jgi:nitroreductase
VSADRAPIERVRPLLRTRQVREFTAEPPTDAELDALTEVARWSGSSENSQPWRFIVVRDRAAIARLHEAGLPTTRSLRTAQVAIAIVVPDDPAEAISHAFDEGRVAERLLVAATLLDLAAGIAWLRADVRPLAAELFGLPTGRFVRTVVVVGHATEAARQPKSAPGAARLPADQVVFRDRWQGD